MTKPEPKTLQEMRSKKPQTPGRDWATIGMLAFFGIVLTSLAVVALTLWLS